MGRPPWSRLLLANGRHGLSSGGRGVNGHKNTAARTLQPPAGLVPGLILASASS
jgi:hypothetical protein